MPSENVPSMGGGRNCRRTPASFGDGGTSSCALAAITNASKTGRRRRNGPNDGSRLTNDEGITDGHTRGTSPQLAGDPSFWLRVFVVIRHLSFGFRYFLQVISPVQVRENIVPPFAVLEKVFLDRI